jgi:hypothetical protein
MKFLDFSMKSTKMRLFHPSPTLHAYTCRHSGSKQEGIGMPTTNDEPCNPDHVPNCRILRESECRGAATYLCNPTSPWVIHPCKLEKCRLRQVCTGPMQPSQFSRDRVFAMTWDGVRSYDLVDLPACATEGNADFRKRFEAMRKRFREALSEEADKRWPKVAEIMKDLRWNKPGWLRAHIALTEKP